MERPKVPLLFNIGLLHVSTGRPLEAQIATSHLVGVGGLALDIMPQVIQDVGRSSRLLMPQLG